MSPLTLHVDNSRPFSRVQSVHPQPCFTHCPSCLPPPLLGWQHRQLDHYTTAITVAVYTLQTYTIQCHTLSINALRMFGGHNSQDKAYSKFQNYCQWSEKHLHNSVSSRWHAVVMETARDASYFIPLDGLQITDIDVFLTSLRGEKYGCVRCVNNVSRREDAYILWELSQ